MERTRKGNAVAATANRAADSSSETAGLYVLACEALHCTRYNFRSTYITAALFLLLVFSYTPPATLQKLTTAINFGRWGWLSTRAGCQSGRRQSTWRGTTCCRGQLPFCPSWLWRLRRGSRSATWLLPQVRGQLPNVWFALRLALLCVRWTSNHENALETACTSSSLLQADAQHRAENTASAPAVLDCLLAAPSWVRLE